MRGDAGAATTEFVIAAPAFLFMLMLIIQAGLYFHAVSIASAAAQEGVRDATVRGGTIAQGEQTANDFVATLAPRLLTDVGVNGAFVDGGEMVRMNVTGDVTEVFKIPGVNIDWSVDESAETVIERFRPTGDVPTDST